MDKLTEFFYMGGYALYVWPAYGVVLLVLICNWLNAVVQRRKILREIKQRSIRKINQV